MCLICVSMVYGQQEGADTSVSSAAAQANGSTVPRLINYSGTLKDSSGKPLTGSVALTLALYAEQEGGPALWFETQTVELDDQGHYSLLLGSTEPAGLPLDLFTSGEAKWLGIEPVLSKATEQPRVLLVGMPYALKASDADTLGGLPARAFMQAAAPAASGPASAPSSRVSDAQAGAQETSVFPALSGGGSLNFLPIWLSSTKQGDSVLFQSGSGSSAMIGLNTINPASTLDVNGAGTVRGTLSLPATGSATSSGGKNSQAASLQASAFSSSTSAALKQTFNLQAEPAGNNTVTPSATLNLLFASGAGTPAETGLSIASNGVLTFAPGQTFPGSGSVSGVTAGTDLTGGGTSGNVTLNVDTSKVPQLAASNAFIGNQGITGSLTATGVITASAFSGNGSGLTGVGTVSGVAAGTDLTGGGTSGMVTLNLDVTKVPLLSAANSFTGNQSITGNLSASGTVTAGGAVLPSTGAATASTGFASQPLDAVASSFKAFTNTSVTQDFRWQAEPVNNNTTVPSGSLNLLFGSGGAAPAETGLSIASNGQITFASGQTFPGTAGGTITGVTAGTALTGGGASGNVTLNLDTTQVPLLNAANTFTGTQSVFGGVAALLFTGIGSGLTNVNAAQLGGLPAGSFATLGGSNVFTTQQNVRGNQAYTYIGDPGCGFGYAAIGFGNSGLFCSAYSMLGDGTDTYINRQTGGAMHFREGDGPDQMTILAGGDVQIVGTPTPNPYDFGESTLLYLQDNSSSIDPNIFVASDPVTNNFCSFDVLGNLFCSGSKSAVVPVDQNRMVALYAVESPENWFEDYGGGTLVNGAATVTLDAVFAQAVNTEMAYRVFLTPNGDCRGLYVASKTATSFDVRELGGGHANIDFDYRIIAKRKGYENIRLADKTEAVNRIKAQAAKNAGAKKP